VILPEAPFEFSPGVTPDPRLRSGNSGGAPIPNDPMITSDRREGRGSNPSVSRSVRRACRWLIFRPCAAGTRIPSAFSQREGRRDYKRNRQPELHTPVLEKLVGLIRPEYVWSFRKRWRVT
jgi:hypothetical protein